MEKIKKIHNKFGTCFNQSFSRGFTSTFNALGNIMPKEGQSNLARRKANHYNEVSKFINNSWNTVGGHINSAIVDLNNTLDDNKLTEQEINGSKTNPEESSSNTSAYYTSNNKSKLEIKNEW